jgi:hypothetical protein
VFALLRGAVLGLVWLLASCGTAASEPVEAAPAESAFPNRRTPFEAGEHALAYVSNRLSDSISVVDLVQMQELGRVPVGRDPVDTDGPSPLVADVARGLLYVALGYPESIPSPHATAEGAVGRVGYVQLLALDDLRPLGELRTQQSPSHLALSRDGRLLAIAHSDTARALDLSGSIEARRSSVGLVEPAETIADASAQLRASTTCVVPGAIAQNRDGSRVYVVCTGEDSLAVVETQTGAVLGRVQAGPDRTNKPHALVADLTREQLLVSNQVSSSVVLFSMADAPEPLGMVRVTGVPQFAHWVTDTEILIPTQGPDAVVRADVTTGETLQQVSFEASECGSPSELTAGAQSQLWLVCQGDLYGPGKLLELDRATLQVRRSVELGRAPTRMTLVEP